MNLFARRPRYADVVATLALVVAMGGTAYAALPKNAVGAKQIKTDAVRPAEIKAGAVRSAEIKNGAVRAADLATGSVGTGQVRDGGVTGTDVADGTLGVRHFVGADATVQVDVTMDEDECVTSALPVPGAEVGQVVLLSQLTAPSGFAIGIQPARVSAPDQVSITVCSSQTGSTTISRPMRVVTIG